MKVQERIYRLGTESGRNMNATDTLLVAINGKRSEIKLIDLFETYKQKTDSIVGHSFLGDLTIHENRILLNDDISLSIINKNNDEEIFFVKTQFPLIQFKDKETDDAFKIMIIENEYKRLFKEEDENPLREAKNDILVEIKSPEAAQQEIENEDKELENEEGLDEEKKEENLSAESNYEEELKSLIEQGYKEFKAGNYRLLYNEETKMFIFVELSGNTYKTPIIDRKKELDSVIITVQDGATLIFDYQSLVLRKKATTV